MKQRLAQLPAKITGRSTATRGTASPFKYACWSFISGTTGVLAIILLASASGQPLLIGSFGASAMLLFGVTDSPLAQPRNLIFGHLMAAAIAVSIVALFGSGPLPCAFAVGLAIMAMNLTGTEHPPAAATTLIGVQGGAGPLFILSPVLVGVIVLLLVALVTNNVVYHRHYPKQWW